MEPRNVNAATWEQVRDLLIEGGTPYSTPNYDFLVPLLPDALLPPRIANFNTKAVFEGLLKRVFNAPREDMSNSSVGFILAARDLFGWTDASYEEVYAAAKVELPKDRLPEFEADGAREQIEARRQELLKYVDVRRRLASFRIVKRGTRARTIVNTYSQPIAETLLAAIHTILSSDAAVNALAKELYGDQVSPPVSPPLAFAEPPLARPLRLPRLSRRTAIALALCVFVGAIVSLFLIFFPSRNQGNGTGQTGANGGTGQLNSSVQTIPLSITDPPKLSPAAPVARDITVAGVGTSGLPGYHRWIFVHADDGMYYPQGGTESLGNGSWAIPDVTIGASGSDDIGHDFIVYVLQVDDSTDSEIRNFMSPISAGEAAYSEADWTSKFLRFKVDEVAVQRTGCACPTATS